NQSLLLHHHLNLKKTQKHRKTKRKATEISQSSGPTNLVADETTYEERGDSVERAATTATSLDADQGSGGSPRRQYTMGDKPAQSRFERLSKQSNKPPLVRVNTLRSGEDSMKLQELMDLCTKLSERVLNLENVKDAQALEIKKLKKRKLGDQEDLAKQGRNEINQNERISWFQEDSETQGRYAHDIGVNTTSTSITSTIINITTAEPVTTASAPITTASISISTVELSTPPPPTTTTLIEDEDLTIAQTLMKMRSKKSKAKGVTMQEPSESGIRRLQAELDKEAKLEREREKEASKAANITEWDDVQAMMDVDYKLAAKLHAEEQGEISIKERSKLFLELMNERKKHFAILRAEEQRRKPPTKTQKRNLMPTYLKNMDG
ncbi:hypothetical protein Tco_1456261, partial [Tanacetum coccineum]